MQVDWYHCKGGVWCELNKIDLDHHYLEGLEGIYIVWYGTDKKTVLKVGYGKIRDELRKSRFDITIQAFLRAGLYVTWADIPANIKEAAAGYLFKKLNPKFTRMPIKKITTKVNLPW